jgi:hypothetical protein
VGAALAVGGGILELGGGAVVAGKAAAETVGWGLWVFFRGLEVADLVYGD